MYFDLTYVDFVFHSYLKWRDIALNPETCPKFISVTRCSSPTVYLQIPQVPSSSVSISWDRILHRVNGAVVEARWTYGRIHYSGRGDTNRLSSAHITQRGCEIEALMLLALAFQDEESYKILDFFLEVTRNPRVKFAYITSERHPQPLDKDKPPWTPFVPPDAHVLPYDL